MLTTLALLAAGATAEPVEFATPTLLLANGVPVNSVEKMPYPSPVLFDIDRDGARELVCGDLWGYLWVHENTASDGEPVWGPSKKLQSIEGEDIQVSNW